MKYIYNKGHKRADETITAADQEPHQNPEQQQASLKKVFKSWGRGGGCLVTHSWWEGIGPGSGLLFPSGPSGRSCKSEWSKRGHVSAYIQFKPCQSLCSVGQTGHLHVSWEEHTSPWEGPPPAQPTCPSRKGFC